MTKIYCNRNIVKTVINFKKLRSFTQFFSPLGAYGKKLWGFGGKAPVYKNSYSLNLFFVMYLR